MSYHSRQLKELQKIWYEKLRKEGFKDIEDTTKSDRPLEAWHSQRFQKIHHTKFEITQTYYYRAKELLLTYEFQNTIHRQIWELHSEGKSKRQIEKEISDLKKAYKREAIGLIIKKIAKEIK